MEPIKIRGRGTAENPPNRFERLTFEPDPAAADPDDPAPGKQTQYYRDHSRTIIAHNDSPDVGFEYSINPFRGCEHGCCYCLSGDTPILMADGSLRWIAELRPGDMVYGTERRGRYRRYVATPVLAQWSTRKPAYRITLEDGTALVASGDHRFLTERGWKFVSGSEQGRERRPHLTTNNKLMGTGAFTPSPPDTQEYRRGYLCGLIRGGGLLASYHYQSERRAREDQYQFRLALADGEALRRAEEYLLNLGIPTLRFLFQRPREGRKPLHAIRTHARERVSRIQTLVAWPAAPSPEWSRGYLAGIFDAEGSYSAGVLRIVNTDPTIIAAISHALRQLGFAFVEESRQRTVGKPLLVVRLAGGLREHLRFFHTTDPAILRKRQISGQAVKNTAALHIAEIEPLPGKFTLFDVTTGTGDFIANGVVSHNCYARPTHEWLGFSAGLDFETRILVKEDAPELLRQELSSTRWTPTTLAMSGVTDPYQPIERRLRLTRRCLEVLVEFRNPVAIVTKNHLVTRDSDLLAELARHGAAVVFLSITTLDPELQRVMEPRTSTPARRLDALRQLSAVGVPVGVMAAPVIPGLTDHEMPAILQAAADAGARTAGYVPLRLPLGVKDLFAHWLEAHFPERKEKVLGRVRGMRGGKLNDSRFRSRMRGEGVYADQIRALFHAAARKAGLNQQRVNLSTSAFRRPDPTGQLGLFDAAGTP